MIEGRFKNIDFFIKNKKNDLFTNISSGVLVEVSYQKI